MVTHHLAWVRAPDGTQSPPAAGSHLRNQLLSGIEPLQPPACRPCHPWTLRLGTSSSVSAQIDTVEASTDDELDTVQRVACPANVEAAGPVGDARCGCTVVTTLLPSTKDDENQSTVGPLGEGTSSATLHAFAMGDSECGNGESALHSITSTTPVDLL
jgi:hypothetical protein